MLSVSAGNEFEAGLDVVLGFVELPSACDLKISFGIHSV